MDTQFHNSRRNDQCSILFEYLGLEVYLYIMHCGARTATCHSMSYIMHDMNTTPKMQTELKRIGFAFKFCPSWPHSALYVFFSLWMLIVVVILFISNRILLGVGITSTFRQTSRVFSFLRFRYIESKVVHIFS